MEQVALKQQAFVEHTWAHHILIRVCSPKDQHLSGLLIAQINPALIWMIVNLQRFLDMVGIYIIAGDKIAARVYCASVAESERPVFNGALEGRPYAVGGYH